MKMILAFLLILATSDFRELDQFCSIKLAFLVCETII